VIARLPSSGVITGHSRSRPDRGGSVGNETVYQIWVEGADNADSMYEDRDKAITAADEIAALIQFTGAVNVFEIRSSGSHQLTRIYRAQS
jgi:hypothetical protein